MEWGFCLVIYIFISQGRCKALFSQLRIGCIFHHTLFPFIYFTHFPHKNIYLKKRRIIQAHYYSNSPLNQTVFLNAALTKLGIICVSGGGGGGGVIGLYTTYIFYICVNQMNPWCPIGMDVVGACAPSGTMSSLRVAAVLPPFGVSGSDPNFLNIASV